MDRGRRDRQKSGWENWFENENGLRQRSPKLPRSLFVHFFLDKKVGKNQGCHYNFEIAVNSFRQFSGTRFAQTPENCLLHSLSNEQNRSGCQMKEHEFV